MRISDGAKTVRKKISRKRITPFENALYGLDIYKNL